MLAMPDGAVSNAEVFNDGYGGKVVCQDKARFMPFERSTA
ncbi:MAG: hypothetical protein ACJAXJ_001463 [Colwellia sp.]|jgi:hypothetical protein|tara:strand:+ start:226 stop:345 length:120 start_codon:yes stop_codon:yes gene_type:complete